MDNRQAWGGLGIYVQRPANRSKFRTDRKLNPSHMRRRRDAHCVQLSWIPSDPTMGSNATGSRHDVGSTSLAAAARRPDETTEGLPKSAVRGLSGCNAFCLLLTRTEAGGLEVGRHPDFQEFSPMDTHELARLNRISGIQSELSNPCVDPPSGPADSRVQRSLEYRRATVEPNPFSDDPRRSRVLY